MKRCLATLAVLAVLAAVPLSHFALAHDSGGGEGITVCHVERGLSNHQGNTLYFGHFITISPDSLADHLAHGDVLVLEPARGCCAGCLRGDGSECPVRID